MYSTLRFYNVEFNMEENPRVDDLEDYLSGLLQKKTISNFQYIRNNLDIVIKIDESQELVDDFDYNYCAIDTDDVTMYYYVTNVTQTAAQTLSLNLHMDTINSLYDPRDFTDETEIQREHRDRFKKPSAWNPTTGGRVSRLVDKNSEGLVTEKRLQGKQALEKDEMDWYLIYRNQNDIDPENPDAPNPVDTYLCASEQLLLSVQGGNPPRGYNPADLITNQFHYVTKEDNPVFYEQTSADIISQCDARLNPELGGSPQYRQAQVAIGRQVAVMRRTDYGVYEDIYEVRSFRFVSTGTSIVVSMSIKLVEPEKYHHTAVTREDTATFPGFIAAHIGGERVYAFVASVVTPAIIVNSLVKARISTLGDIPLDYASSLINETLTFNIGEELPIETVSSDTIPRTDTRLIKIIKLPYCPVMYTKTDEGIYVFPDDWVNEDGLLKWTGTALIPTLGFDEIVERSIPNMNINLPPINTHTASSQIRESKLYHSDFYSIKFTYDSFSKEIKMEHIDMDADAGANPKVIVDFKPTSTINSKLGFRFHLDEAVDNYSEEQDFDDILLATRNNEETILNNAYINYIKTGYNYDKKANALQLENARRNAGVNTTISTAATIGTILSALIPGGQGLSFGLAATAIGTGINTANQWVNVQKTEEQQQNTMQSKLAQLQQQATSTAGTDDVDLMSWYSNNRLWIMNYNSSELTLKRLYHLFRLTGYAYHTYDIPDVDSRYWYNFIQCDPHVIKDGTRLLKNEWLEDLKQKYNQGVTVFHNHSNEWNFERNFENWETWIVEGIN